MAENPLTKLPLAGQLGVSAVIAALLCGGFYYFWYSDALETQKKQEAKLAELQKQIRALEATANKLPEFQREVQALEARLETLKRILPPEKEMPDLMRRVQYLAAQSSLQIRKFNPAAPAQKEFYQEVPVNLDLEGTYHNLGAFLDRVSRMSRLVNVGNVKIKAQTKPTINNTIAASAVATTYVYQDDPARGRDPEGQAADAWSERDEGARHEARCSPSHSPSLLAGPALAPGAGRGHPATRPPRPLPGAADAARPPLDVELETGGYSYNSQGRRDPFVSLQRPVAADRGPKTRKPGMEGFLIQEIALKGIVKTKGGGIGEASRSGFIAMFLGADGKSYFVTTGQRLYDGVITAVDATSVTFRQEVTDPLSPVKTREVRKSLYASEEARQ